MKNSMTKLGLAATLSLAAMAAHAEEQTALKAKPASVTPAPVVTTASASQGGLTRTQVREDLERYQREHANPSYAELVFLR